MFHAFESEENRAEMIGWVMSTFHLLHIIDVLKPQVERSERSILRAEGDATFRDYSPKTEELPVACQELLRIIHEKVNKPAAPIVEPQKFTKEEFQQTCTMDHLMRKRATPGMMLMSMSTRGL